MTTSRYTGTEPTNYEGAAELLDCAATKIDGGHFIQGSAALRYDDKYCVMTGLGQCNHEAYKRLMSATGLSEQERGRLSGALTTATELIRERLDLGEAASAIVKWNDALDRTEAEVVQMLRDTADEARRRSTEGA